MLLKQPNLSDDLPQGAVLLTILDVNTKDPSWNTNTPKHTPQHARPQHDCPTNILTPSSVMPPPSALLPSHSRKTKFSAFKKSLLFQFSSFLIAYAWNCVTWNWLNRRVSVWRFVLKYVQEVPCKSQPSAINYVLFYKITEIVISNV
jgi:hypothetical protein